MGRFEQLVTEFLPPEFQHYTRDEVRRRMELAFKLGQNCELETVLRKADLPATKDEPGVYIIRNSIGCEVARVTADNDSEALVDYAIQTGVTSERLREICWRAERVADGG